MGSSLTQGGSPLFMRPEGGACLFSCWGSPPPPTSHVDMDGTPLPFSGTGLRRRRVSSHQPKRGSGGGPPGFHERVTPTPLSFQREGVPVGGGLGGYLFHQLGHTTLYSFSRHAQPTPPRFNTLSTVSPNSRVPTDPPRSRVQIPCARTSRIASSIRSAPS